MSERQRNAMISILNRRKSHNKCHEIGFRGLSQNPSSARFLAMTKVWFLIRRPRRLRSFSPFTSFESAAINFFTFGEDETTSVLPASETASALLSSPSSVSTVAAAVESATSVPNGSSDLATAESFSKVSSSTFYRINKTAW